MGEGTVKISMQIRGTDDLQRRAHHMAKAVFDVSSKNVLSTCRRVVQTARAFAPYRTGALHDAITYSTSPQGTKGWVGIRKGSPAAVYWHFVEFGTVHSRARPYLRPAAESEWSSFVTTEYNGVRKAVEG